MQLLMPADVRPRIINDDAVQLVDPETGVVRRWAYWLPRDAIHKYRHRDGLWASHVRNDLFFSRPLTAGEAGLDVYVPVMREPTMFRLRPLEPDGTVPITVREQLVDFDYPDLVIMKAAYFYAQTDPIMQPRVQTLEANYKELMYALVERDTRNTDSPYQNDWTLDIESSVNGGSSYGGGRPLADERGFHASR